MSSERAESEKWGKLLNPQARMQYLSNEVSKKSRKQRAESHFIIRIVIRWGSEGGRMVRVRK